MKSLYRLLNAFVLILIFNIHAGATDSPPASSENNICIDLYMYDSFGDGWDGAGYYISNWTGLVVASGIGPATSSSVTSICLPDGCYTMEVTAGNFPSEITWAMYGTNEGYIGGGAPTTITFTVGSIHYGCTDPYNCNYWNYANCDDGTCCYDYCVDVYMTDSFGDGWNGASLTLSNNQGTEWTTTMPDGTGNGHYQFFCLEAGCYEIVVTAGSFPSEIGWQVVASNDTIAAGGAPHNGFIGITYDCDFKACANPDACNYTMNAAYQSGFCCLDYCSFMFMYDSYGDGWNGAEYTLTDWRGNALHSGTLASTDYGYEELCLTDGCYTISTTPGGYAYEGTWGIAVPGAYITGALGDSQTFTVGTPTEGCTNPTAANYNPLANCDNSTCTVTCDSDLDGNGQVNVGDLLIFSSQFGMTCY